MERSLYVSMTTTVTEGTEIGMLVAPASTGRTEESLIVRGGGRTFVAEEEVDPYGNRVHLVRGLPAGQVEVIFDATVDGGTSPAEVSPVDEVMFVRPSRYCEVDEFGRIAADIVDGATGLQAARTIVDWVAGHIAYVPGSSTVLDSARTTFMSRQGVCRDFAHLTTTLLRATGIPARCVSVYAPGLSPMDFHLVVEALIDSRWVVFDATHLAPRESMLRIATGMDAADTAFMTTLVGDVQLELMQVLATVAGDLPAEDWSQIVELS